MRNILIIMFCTPFLLAVSGDATLASDIDKQKYLTGEFEPSRAQGFVSLQKLGISVKNGPHYLRREAAESLSKMIKDFKKEHPKIELWVQSSTRNFKSQKSIWNSKWRGERSSNGMNLSKETDLVKRARFILEYSSMPGTSRHHWGTDVDFNILNNEYYERGEGKILFEWLIANASRYGFARPYTPLRAKGYREERWHWSYLPLSRGLYREWMARFADDRSYFTRKGFFDGSEIAGNFAREYVESINPECM